ncbi:hypothetical protein [Algoriphagus litoralis]|uniref:hypothetical protein n=1 Tax=Algoriphagus litoralis TaxID=2202829 RepID=UPI000DBA3AD3|nr:hypothetical protein [Algoriphagus litoralis]
MNRLLSLFHQPIRNYRKWDFLIFTCITAASIVQGQSTVFYILYFFWWNELIRILVDRIAVKFNPNAQVTENGGIGSSLFLMGIYWVFLVVFFALIATWDDQELSFVNLEILTFQNWFFNANLIFVLLERIYLHQRQAPLSVSFGGFTLNMIVIHISIILGGILMFFVVKNYPGIFTPENRWGSLLIISPFLAIRMGVDWFSSSK